MTRSFYVFWIWFSITWPMQSCFPGNTGYSQTPPQRVVRRSACHWIGLCTSAVKTKPVSPSFWEILMDSIFYVVRTAWWYSVATFSTRQIQLMCCDCDWVTALRYWHDCRTTEGSGVLSYHFTLYTRGSAVAVQGLLICRDTVLGQTMGITNYCVCMSWHFNLWVN